MKFRIVITLLTLLVLGGVAYIESNSTPSEQSQPQAAPSDGIVLH